ncbi:DUF1993 domain-containing protein [Phenylobacterium montanum]|uniref:DUF1993 domain-containing protein n=1 Tax=Phenylobacterium montanum TaxID=2823693 RepID=A0A975FZN2_9CAUL|nr:DUF1993 domain-containing protein [Caulobacter sp. S6]QUD87894.1 DUF1993 domain-containing protein [Caulobacter sp. S6]
MSLSMHQASVATFTRALGNLSAILKKAEAYAETKGVDPSVVLGSRLAIDMHPLSKQIQFACDGAKRGAARLAGVEPPSHPDTETSFAEFQARIASTIAYLESLKPEQYEGAAERTVTLPLPGGEMKFDGASFLTGFALPNFYFHVTTAYAILRHNGLAIGKMDFLGGV